MPKQIILFFITVVLFSNILNAQSLAVNTDGSSANASALMDVKSPSLTETLLLHLQLA